MDNNTERRVCIKFYLKLGKNTTKTFGLIKLAFEDNSLSRCVTFDWYKFQRKPYPLKMTNVLGNLQYRKQMIPLLLIY